MTKAATDNDLAYVQTSLGNDLDSMLVFNILRTHNCLAPWIDAGLRQSNLTAAQFNTLLVLRSAGATGMLMGEIGERLVVTKSNVTGLIDRLETQGLVTRCAHDDRRATTVRLTRAGSDLLKRALPQLSELLAELSDCLKPAEKDTLVRLLSKLRRELRRRGTGAP